MMAAAILWFECDSSPLMNWVIATTAVMLLVEESSTYWYRYSFRVSSSAKVSTAASQRRCGIGFSGVPRERCPSQGSNVAGMGTTGPTDSACRKQSGEHLARQTRIWTQLKTLSPKLSPTSRNDFLNPAEDFQ